MEKTTWESKEDIVDPFQTKLPVHGIIPTQEHKKKLTHEGRSKGILGLLRNWFIVNKQKKW